MKLFSRFLFFVLFLFAATIFSAQAHAMTVRGGEAVYVPKDEIVSGSLFAGGNAVTIDGVVHGDVFCGSQTVVIAGTVDGDVICGAQTISITGSVGGNLRAGAQTIDISGSIKRNVTAAGQTITIDPTGSVAGEVLAAAQKLSVYGLVSGDISAGTETLTFGDNAKVGGSVWYQSKSTAIVAPSATIAGTLTQKVPTPEKETTPKREMKKATGGGAVNILWKIIMYTVFAIILSAVAPKYTQRVLTLMRTKPGPMALTGFLVLIIVPVLIIALFITLIGIPFAILLGLLYALVLAVSRIFTAMIVGEYLMEKFNGAKAANKFVTLILGVTVTWVVFSIPVIGSFASGLAMIWGLGAIYQSRKAAVTGKRK